MNGWMNNPKLQNIDPIKLELMKVAARQTEGKSGKALAPVMMTLITAAGQKGIHFSPEEISLILEIIKEGKSPEEQAQIHQLSKMVGSYFKK